MTHLDDEFKLKRLIVVGAGAVGGGIGGLLAEAGHEVVLVARGAHGTVIRRDGLSIRMPNRSLITKPPCVEQNDQVDWQFGDVAMLATKLQDAKVVLDELLDAAGSSLPVVCAVNGLHGERLAQARFENVVSMLVWVPATHLQPGEVILHGSGCPGVLDVGPTCGEQSASISKRLAAKLNEVGFDSVVREDILRWKYAKLITNLGGAAQAMVTEDWQRVAEVARQEGESVLEAAGVDRIPTAQLRDRTRHVQTGAVDGKPRQGGSTWQSYTRGRSLESPWLEGAIAELAAQFGLPAPVNAFLAQAARSPRPLTADEVLASQDSSFESAME